MEAIVKLIHLFVFLLVVSCTPSINTDAKTQYIENNDALRRGKDRVYIAYRDVITDKINEVGKKQKALISNHYPDLNYGNQLMYVIGCYGEPESHMHPNNVTNMEEDPKGGLFPRTTIVPLNARTKLSHFGLYKDRSEARKNSGCYVLAGGNSGLQLAVIPEDSPLQERPITLGYDHQRLGYDLVCLGAAAESVVVMFAIGSMFLGPAGMVAGAAALALSSITYGMTVDWCLDKRKGYIAGEFEHHRTNNEIIFFKHMKAAHEKAVYELYNSPQNKEKRLLYAEILADKEMEPTLKNNLASAILTPFIVHYFNTMVSKETFEQGWLWDIRKNDIGFRAFEQLDLGKLSDNAKEHFDIHNSAYVHCSNSEIIDTCTKGDGGITCFRESGCVMKDHMLIEYKKPKR